jgi:hypothetical protein
MPVRDFLNNLPRRTAAKGARVGFWRPPGPGQYRFRLYCFKHDGHLELFMPDPKHYVDGEGYIRCPDPSNCRVCDTVLNLEAALDQGSKDMAKKMRRDNNKVFVICLSSTPQNFDLYGVSEAQAWQIMLKIAELGGYVGRRPKTREEDDAFFPALEKAMPAVCGPQGKDIILKYDPNAPTAKEIYTWGMDMIGSMPLPMEQDDKVPDPFQITASIQASKERKAAGGQ